jgi:phage-related minor tail protein
MAQRSAEEIRSSIEANRQELAVSVQRLRGEVERVTDWRAHVERHRSELTAGAAVAGLLLATRLLRRRRRRG